MLIEMLGVGAPQQGSFFITFIMLMTCKYGFLLLCPRPLFIFFCRRQLAETERAKYRWVGRPAGLVDAWDDPGQARIPWVNGRWVGRWQDLSG